MSLEDRLYPLLNVYEHLPGWFKETVGFAFRHLPQSWRLGKKYREFKDLAMQGESWTPDECADYQFKNLRAVLIQAASYCPYYERTFAKARFQPETMRSIDGFNECPHLEKREVQEHLPEFVSSQFKASNRLYITTGGSTGVPVGFYLQQGVSRPKEQAFLETMWHRAGWIEGSRLAVIRGHVTTSKAQGRIATHDPTRDWLLLSSAHLSQERLPEYLAQIESFKPDMLHVYPSAALQLAEFLEKSCNSWRTPLRGLLCGSERLTLPQKRLLEKVFKCRVYRWYGHSERVVLAGEGTQSELFYFWPQYGYVEFGPPDAEGLREVIGTSFHNMAMPLIRYHTGDFVRLAETGTPLEFPWPAAVEIAGRSQEFLVSKSGRRISLTMFNMHDAIFDDLYAVQFYQEQLGQVEFRYLPSPRFHRSRLAPIEMGIQRKLGDDFQITLREVHDMEKTARGKHCWVVSRLS